MDANATPTKGETFEELSARIAAENAAIQDECDSWTDQMDAMTEDDEGQ